MASKRLRRAVDLAFLLLLGTALVSARIDLFGTRADRQLEAGLAALAHALAGAPERFEEAERSLAAAASNVVLDAYPLFALEMARLLRGAPDAAPSPELAPILAALSRNRPEDALALAASRADPRPQGELLVRFCADLVRFTPR